MYYSLEGNWKAVLSDGTEGDIRLPGTLDENRLGHKDLGLNQWHSDAENGGGGFNPDAPIATRFTRKYTYEGEALFSRRISFKQEEGERVFLEAERSRCLKLLVDGNEVPHFIPASINTPQVFEVTGMLGEDTELTLVSDNSYPGLPHDAIVFSSAATDETQTNWNGVLGYVRLRTEKEVFLSSLRVYPVQQTLTVAADLSVSGKGLRAGTGMEDGSGTADRSGMADGSGTANGAGMEEGTGMPETDGAWHGTLTIRSEALAETCITTPVTLSEGMNEIRIEGLLLAEHVKRWDEYEGNLYELSALLTGDVEKRVTFGVRDFGDNGKGRLALNGRTIFLRSEANCAEFPETGYTPMTEKEWTDILNTYKAYGINCVRFHSHCPSEAAFAAADRLGMMMQPELSHWNPNDAFESGESFSYYQQELALTIRWLANHPSFVMLTFGNELCTGETGRERMSRMLEQARALDSTRLYANGSNVHYGRIGCDPDSDFYTSQSYFEAPLRGTFAGEAEPQKKTGRIRGYINNQYPNTRTNYDASMEKLRQTFQKPVFSFEVGQFEVLPDFEELTAFQGISDPANFRIIQEKADMLGLSPVWKRYVEASGELSRIGYREEIEAAMRTKELSGISLLGLQDFPGQGTALVGMMNSHMQPKPYPFARPELFQSFFRDQLPLVQMEKYTYCADEVLKADILAANFGKKDICERPVYELKGSGISVEGTLPEADCRMGELSHAGTLEIPLNMVKKAARLDLTVRIGEMSNTYPVWVYPAENPVCPESVYETERLDSRAKEVLEAGGRVYLTPPSREENLPHSIRAQFTTDFWSVGNFAAQEGGMGQLIDEKHPLFEEFPTEFHTNWQWWPMAGQRAVILPQPMKAIITEMDSYAYMRPMIQLMECRCGNGKLMLSSLGLQELQQYPEARALLSAIYRYMDSERFDPEQSMEAEIIEELVR